MGLGNLRMLYLVATLLIVCELSLTTVSSRYAMAAATVDSTSASFTLKEAEMNVNSFTHINKHSAMTEKLNRLPRHTVQGLQQQQQKLKLNQQQSQQQKQEYSQQIEDPSSFENSKIKRNFAISGGWASTALNSIGNSNNDAAQQPTNHQYQQYTEAKPIYEEQHENDYAGGGGSSGPIYGPHSGAGVANAAALHSAIYNLQTAGTHNAAVETSGSGSSASNSGSDGFLPSWKFGKLSTSFLASKGTSTPYTGSIAGVSINNDKTSEGNFLHHYNFASVLNEYKPQYEYEYQQQQQQQQQQQIQNHEKFYNSIEHTDADTSASYADEHEHDNNNNNYSPSGPAAQFSHYQQHDFEHQQQQEKQPDVINYVPYPVVKKQHVPVREPVQIPVSHAVIIPVSKPVPIHIPIFKNVQVPVEQELKIPVERVVPYPVEKHIPVPVEKRVPYPVVKYVPIKVPRPFPVKVPVFKTVLHKVKGWW